MKYTATGVAQLIVGGWWTECLLLYNLMEKNHSECSIAFLGSFSYHTAAPEIKKQEQRGSVIYEYWQCFVFKAEPVGSVQESKEVST